MTAATPTERRATARRAGEEPSKAAKTAKAAKAAEAAKAAKTVEEAKGRRRS